MFWTCHQFQVWRPIGYHKHVSSMYQTHRANSQVTLNHSKTEGHQNEVGLGHCPNLSAYQFDIYKDLGVIPYLPCSDRDGGWVVVQVWTGGLSAKCCLCARLLQSCRQMYTGRRSHNAIVCRTIRTPLLNAPTYLSYTPSYPLCTHLPSPPQQSLFTLRKLQPMAE